MANNPTFDFFHPPAGMEEDG